MTTQRDSIEFDVLFVGGGPANLAGAIRLMQLAEANNRTLEVALIEKGNAIGAHTVSGAVLNPRALTELIPEHRDRGCPIEAEVGEDAFYFLTAAKAIKAPLVPREMRNHGHYIISLSQFSQWLGGLAEEMGINVFPEFAGVEMLYADDGRTVTGVRTGDKGLAKDGSLKNNFEPGIDLLAKVTVLGEGARGSLTLELAKKLDIFKERQPQVFETGIKEVIQLPDGNSFHGQGANDLHFLGYPLGLTTPGGGFIYEMRKKRIAIGYLTGLCYENPWVDPYEAFLKFKRHPFVADIITGGKVLEQGARTVSSGGLYTVPRLAVDGALIVGGGAAMQNMQALKGIHLAMKSGMLAAEAIDRAFELDRFDSTTLGHYRTLFDESWAQTEMRGSRNLAQALAKKGPAKFIHLGAQYVTEGRGLRDPMILEADKHTLQWADQAKRGVFSGIAPDQVDGELYVDKLTGVYLSKTQHREDQPNHIIVHDTRRCATECYETYRNPCTRFCPGNVYEIEEDEGTGARSLKLNPANCFHCKTCDIKDPYGNITWTCPEGGDGPGYQLV